VGSFRTNNAFWTCKSLRQRYSRWSVHRVNRFIAISSVQEFIPLQVQGSETDCQDNEISVSKRWTTEFKRLMKTRTCTAGWNGDVHVPFRLDHISLPSHVDKCCPVLISSLLTNFPKCDGIQDTLSHRKSDFYRIAIGFFQFFYCILSNSRRTSLLVQ